VFFLPNVNDFLQSHTRFWVATERLLYVWLIPQTIQYRPQVAQHTIQYNTQDMTAGRIAYVRGPYYGKTFATCVSKASLGLEFPFDGGSDRGGVCVSSMVKVLERRKPGHP